MPKRNRSLAARRGTRAELRVATVLGVARIGGPGREDYKVRGKRWENKAWDTRAVHAGVISKAKRAGYHGVNASGRKGFSKGAEVRAAKLGIRLTRVR